MGPETIETTRKLFLSNISPNATEAHVEEILGIYGKVKSVSMSVVAHGINCHRVTAVVEFYTREDAQTALDYVDGMNFDSLTLCVNWTLEKNPVKAEEKRRQAIQLANARKSKLARKTRSSARFGWYSDRHAEEPARKFNDSAERSFRDGAASKKYAHHSAGNRQVSPSSSSPEYSDERRYQHSPSPTDDNDSIRWSSSRYKLSPPRDRSRRTSHYKYSRKRSPPGTHSSAMSPRDDGYDNAHHVGSKRLIGTKRSSERSKIFQKLSPPHENYTVESGYSPRTSPTSWNEHSKYYGLASSCSSSSSSSVSPQKESTA